MLKIDISEEHLISSFGGGLILTAPHHSTISSTVMSVKKLLTFPMQVFILRIDSSIVLFNEMSLMTCSSLNPNSQKDLLGKKTEYLFTQEGLAKLIQNDKAVLASKTVKIFEETLIRVDDFEFPIISYKFPLYNEARRMIGILGLGVLTAGHFSYVKSSLSNSLQLIMDSKVTPLSRPVS